MIGKLPPGWELGKAPLPTLDIPLVSDALLSPAYVANWSTPALRALFFIDAAMHEVRPEAERGGAPALYKDLKLSRETALSALTPEERAQYSKRIPIEIVRETHANAMHTLSLSSRDIQNVFGISPETLICWMKHGFPPGFMRAAPTSHKKPRRVVSLTKRYIAADVIAFCVRNGMPVPPPLLPGATWEDFPRGLPRKSGAATATQKRKPRRPRGPPRIFHGDPPEADIDPTFEDDPEGTYDDGGDGLPGEWESVD